MKRWFKRTVLAAAVVGVGLQCIPVERNNPPERGGPAAPVEVQGLLRRACYDCHSNETRWPWYSRIAPVSLLLAHDVNEGRREVNFSNWDRYDERRKTRKLREIAEQAEHNEMPPWYYLPLHPAAKLSSAERESIVRWARRR